MKRCFHGLDFKGFTRRIAVCYTLVVVMVCILRLIGGANNVLDRYQRFDCIFDFL